MELLIRRLSYVGLAILFVLLVGTTGFTLISDFTLFEAFYMTIITISTVGYSEIHTLTRAGRIFNSVLILFGVTTLFFAIGAITQAVIELELGDVFGKRRLKRMIDKLENHYILCGFGRVGRGSAEELQRSGVPFIVVDRDPAKVERSMRAGMTAVAADSTLDETLKEVGVTRAKGLIAALSTDADNLFVILSAKTLNPALQVAARAAEEGAEQKLRRAGADTVFAPYQLVGHRLAQSLLRPHVHEFLGVTVQSMGLNVGIEQVPVVEGSKFAASTLAKMQIRRDLGVIVLAIRKADGKMLFNPPAEAEISTGDYLIAMGEPDNLRKLESLLAGVTT